MQRQTVRAYGLLIAFLAIAGFFVTDDHLFGLMNADPMLDWLRTILAALLLYAGFMARDANLWRGALSLVGILYVGMAALGLIDSELWGLLPTGLTGFDIIFHALTGVAALAVAGMRKTEVHD